MRKTIRYTLIALAALLVAGQPALAKGARSDLKARVVSELSRYYTTLFQVAVQGPGNVTIKGEVPSYWDKLKVFDLVAHVDGVREISDRIVVKTDIVSDDMIKAKIQDDLALNRMILEPDRIQVVVNEGPVILRGTVSFYREAVAAEDVAAWARGVKSVANEIQTLPPAKAVSDENLTVVLRDLIDRFFPLERKTVQVRVEKGKAILTGTVTHLWARMHIAKEVRRVGGVIGVQNNIDVHILS